jgi:hypothetical protein
MFNLICGIIVGLCLIINPHPDRIFLVLAGVGYILRAINLYVLTTRAERAQDRDSKIDNLLTKAGIK